MIVWIRYNNYIESILVDERLGFRKCIIIHVLVFLSLFIHVATLAMELFNMQKVQYSLLYHPLITGEKRL